MRRMRVRVIAGLVGLGALLAAGTSVAYRVVVERWGGDPRGTLIAAATVGISFFIAMNLLIAWDERRQQRLGQKENGAAATEGDGPR